MDITKMSLDVQLLLGMAKTAGWELQEVRIEREEVLVTLEKRYPPEEKVFIPSA